MEISRICSIISIISIIQGPMGSFWSLRVRSGSKKRGESHGTSEIIHRDSVKKKHRRNVKQLEKKNTQVTAFDLKNR